MKTFPRFLTVALWVFVASFSTLTCQTFTDKEQSLTIEKISVNDKDLFVDSQGLIRIKFNNDELPPEVTVVEIVFNNQYHGFFNVTKEIFLPKLLGAYDLIAIFSVSEGNRIGNPRIYKIEVP